MILQKGERVQAKGNVAESAAEGDGAGERQCSRNCYRRERGESERPCSRNCYRRERVLAKGNLAETAADVRLQAKIRSLKTGPIQLRLHTPTEKHAGLEASRWQPHH